MLLQLPSTPRHPGALPERGSLVWHHGLVTVWSLPFPEQLAPEQLAPAAAPAALPRSAQPLLSARWRPESPLNCSDGSGRLGLV